MRRLLGVAGIVAAAWVGWTVGGELDWRRRKARAVAAAPDGVCQPLGTVRRR